MPFKWGKDLQKGGWRETMVSIHFQVNLSQLGQNRTYAKKQTVYLTMIMQGWDLIQSK